MQSKLYFDFVDHQRIGMYLNVHVEKYACVEIKKSIKMNSIHEINKIPMDYKV